MFTGGARCVDKIRKKLHYLTSKTPRNPLCCQVFQKGAPSRENTTTTAYPPCENNGPAAAEGG
jgi:hypothetical protein